MIEERRDPKTLEEAYHLRDSAGNPDERDFYQEKVYALRRAEYQRRGIPTESSSRRRERRSAVEFSREVFLIEVANIAGRQSAGGEERDRQDARREACRRAVRLDKHASPGRPDSQPDSMPGPARAGVVELYRRNFLELLRAGKSSGEAYYLARVIGPVGDAEFEGALQSVMRTGYPSGRSAYVVQRAAIRIWDLPGGIILILLAFFASLFALVWASTNIWDEAGVGTIFVLALGLIAAGGLMLTSALLAAALRSTGK